VDNEKIAATGINVTHGITRHGIAINIAPDLSHYSYIIACGISDGGVTSFEKLGISNINVEEVKDRFLYEFNQIFNTVIVAPLWKEGEMTNED
jgi:lipoyl(octanoyl) transferase